MKKNLPEKGITLIALVITIIVLLILAGVTLSIVMNTGITNNALKAKDIHQISSYKDSIDVLKNGEILRKRLEGLDTSLKDLVVEKLKEQTWVSTVRTSEEDGSLEENQIQIITKDNYILVAEILEDGTINYLVEDKYDGEPYPTILLEQLPLEGIENEKIKIKVTASVAKQGKTKKVKTIKLESTGETQEYKEEGVIFEVTGNGIYKFIATTDQGKSSSKKIFIDIHGTENIVEITQEPTEARNTIETTGEQNGIATGPIQVTIEYGETELIKEYQIGEGTEWQTTEEETTILEIEENKSISARYSDGRNKFGTKSIQVSNVDNVAPNEFTIDKTNIETTSNSITVKDINVEDTASPDVGPGIADILRYEYKLDIGNWQNNGGVFTGIKTGTHKIKVKAIDKAGNERESTNELSVDIEEISTESIKINAEPKTARNTEETGTVNEVERGPIEVTINYGNNTYTNQYKIGDGDWTPVENNEVTTTFKVDKNTSIIARYFDGTNGFETKAYEIQNVDNVAPTIKNASATINKTIITVNADVSDEASEKAGANIAKVKSTTYSINGGAYQTQNTFTVSTIGEKTINIKAIDNAGNETIVPTKVTVTGHTLTVTAGTGGTVSGDISGTKIEGQSCTVTAKTTDSYKFLGWYDGNTRKSESTTYTFEMPATNYNLVAKFELKTYTITYNANGGTGGPTSQKKTHGVDINLSSETPTKNGFAFMGWSTDSKATTADTKYNPGSKYTSNADLTLYAVWTANSAPVFSTTSVYTRGTTNITIRAKATDTDSGDKLTYKLYLRTENEQYPTQPNYTSDEIASGTAVNLPVTNLTTYTVYKYKVEVTDGKTTVTSSEGTTGTGCNLSNATCTRATSTQVKCGVYTANNSDHINGAICPTCGGEGYRSKLTM